MLKPWLHEPSEATWNAYGFDVEIRRHPRLLTLCGYVSVPRGHPWFGEDYDDIDADVHGGLTYAQLDRRLLRADRWKLGFDCAHYLDLIPAMPEIYDADDNRNTYRDWKYVRGEVESLAKQARKAVRRAKA